MKVLMINVVCGIRSTGRICTDLATALEQQGHEVKIAYGRENVPETFERYAVHIGKKLDLIIHGLRGRILDQCGWGSKNATRKFIRWAEEYNPDMLWLHNLHGYYINIPILFEWIKSRPFMKVQWTLHDCWAFTGHCAYFSMANCYKWKEECGKCDEKKSYPKSLLLDNSRKNYLFKKKAFLGVKNMLLIVPSQWLARYVKESFLADYPIEIQYNSIDKNIFRPTPSCFRENYKLKNKIIILGVATVWDKRKGLDDFIELSKMLNHNYQIVLVGLNKKQIRKLPKNILGIEKTNNAYELAGIYSTADVFVNPSKEETFGMTTVEAEECGTPAIVYKDTACEEIVKARDGIIVEQNVIAIYDAIVRMKLDEQITNISIDTNYE